MQSRVKPFLSRMMVVMAVLFLSKAMTPSYCFAQDDYAKYYGDAYSKDSLGMETADGSGMTGLSGAVEAISNAMTAFLKVVLGAGAVIMLTLIVLRVMRGDREAAMKMFWWVLALVCGFAILVVMGNWHPKAESAGGGSFSGIKVEIANVLMILMKMTATISLALGAVHMMQGEQEGLKKFAITLVVSLMACGVLGLIAGI